MDARRNDGLVSDAFHHVEKGVFVVDVLTARHESSEQRQLQGLVPVTRVAGGQGEVQGALFKRLEEIGA